MDPQGGKETMYQAMSEITFKILTHSILTERKGLILIYIFQGRKLWPWSGCVLPKGPDFTPGVLAPEPRLSVLCCLLLLLVQLIK